MRVLSKALPTNFLLSAFAGTEGAELTYSIVDIPVSGNLICSTNMVDGGGAYTPCATYDGNDSFTFKVNDGINDSNVATVTLLNAAPTAVNQTVTVQKDTPVEFRLSGRDAEGNALTYVPVTQPAQGTLNCVANACTYSPSASYNGNDSFTFKVNDGINDSNVATVTLINNAPIAQDRVVSVLPGTPVEFTLKATDAESDALTYAIALQPEQGDLVCEGARCTYTPGADYDGQDAFRFTVNDGIRDSATATVSLRNLPPEALPQSVFTKVNTPVTIVPGGLDKERGALTYAIASQPANGTLVDWAGQWIYTPATDFEGIDSFTFSAFDGLYTSEAPATVTITVSGQLSADGIWAFEYLGKEQTFTVPRTGTYTIKTWGTQGGAANSSSFGATRSGGKGGYSSALFQLNKGDVLTVMVGGMGESALREHIVNISGGFNGGGTGWTHANCDNAGAGGGASDVRLNGTSLYDRIIVSGGGWRLWLRHGAQHAARLRRERCPRRQWLHRDRCRLRG